MWRRDLRPAGLLIAAAPAGVSMTGASGADPPERLVVGSPGLLADRAKG